MRYAVGLMLGIGLLMYGCVSRDEVARVTSPDGKIDAIVFETNCGATCSFGYNIWLAPKGSRDREEVATLDGAFRSDQAYGVNLKWLDANRLFVEYLRADHSILLKQRVDVAGHGVKVSLREGVTDPQAPAGGMLFNRR